MKLPHVPASGHVMAALAAVLHLGASAVAAEKAPSPIDLPTALKLAGARSLDIQLAKERVAEARAQQTGALLQFAPTLSPGATLRRHDNAAQNVEGRVIDADKRGWTVGPALNLQVDLGESAYKLLAARQLTKAAAFAEEGQRQESILSAALAYCDLAKAQAAEAIAQDAVDISRDYERQVTSAVEAGIAFKGEELRARGQMERDQLTLRQCREAREIAGARLVHVLHLEPGLQLKADGRVTPVEFVKKDQSLPQLIAQARSHRPELGQSAAQLEAARQSRSAAVYGPLWPTLSGQAFGGALGGGFNGGDYQTRESEDYQVSLGWRIGPGGLFDSSRTKAAEARLGMARISAEKVSDDIGRQITESWARVRSLSDQITIAQRTVEAARRTLELTRERREFAVGSVLETILSAQELTRARLEWLGIVAEHNKAQFALSRALGTTPNPAPKESAPASAGSEDKKKAPKNPQSSKNSKGSKDSKG